MSLDLEALRASSPFVISRSGLPDSDASRRLSGDFGSSSSSLAELGDGLREDLRSGTQLADIRLSEGARRALASADEALSIARAFNKEDAASAFGQRAADKLRGFASDLFGRLGGNAEVSASRFEAVFESFSAELSGRVGSLVDKAAFGGFELSGLSISVRAESVELSVASEDGETTIQFQRFELSVELFHLEAGVIADDRFPFDLDGIGFSARQEEASRRLSEIIGVATSETASRERVRAILGDILHRQPLAGLIDSTDGILGDGSLIDTRA